MNKRFFLALALTGVLGLACATPAQAASTLVTTHAGFLVSPPGSNATEMDIVYTLGGGGTITSAAATVGLNTGGLAGLTYTLVGTNEIDIHFAATTGTSPLFPSEPLQFSFFTNATTVGVASVTVKGGNGTGAAVGAFVSLSSVPEPASLALLGIGMTGFLAFRRFFKKTSVA